MFNKTHTDTIVTENQTQASESQISQSVALTFLRSAAVQAFPCGRRRSTSIEAGSSEYRIPFDPEARLNTEANNRKHSGLNGYTQTYLKKWDEANKQLSLSLAGYLFNISLDENTNTANGFGDTVFTNIEEVAPDDSSNTHIYANIVLEDIQLFSQEFLGDSYLEYFTKVLRNQSNTSVKAPLDALDLLDAEGLSVNEMEDPENYYFSGLSFSTKALAALVGADNTGYEEVTRRERDISFLRTNPNDSTTIVNQTIISLCILEKVNVAEEGEDPEYEWQIHQPAYLPFIEHGDTADSIVVTGKTLLKDTLDVKGATTIDNTLTVTTDKATSLGGTLTVNKEATFKDTLTVEDDKATSLGGTLTVAKDVTFESNLTVEDNINIGNPATPATADNGGNIVAEKNITAEQDLIAGNNLQVAGNAEITGNANITGNTNIEIGLVVGDNDITPAEGIIEATKQVKAPEITAITEFSGPKASITDVHATNIYATTIGNDENRVSNLYVTDANINNVIAETVTADTLYQKNGESTMQVPIIELVPDGDYWQLQISRIGAKPTT